MRPSFIELTNFTTTKDRHILECYRGGWRERPEWVDAQQPNEKFKTDSRQEIYSDDATAFWRPGVRHHGRPVRGDRFDAGRAAARCVTLFRSRTSPDKCADLTEGLRAARRAFRAMGCRADRRSIGSTDGTAKEQTRSDIPPAVSPESGGSCAASAVASSARMVCVSQPGETFSSTTPATAR
jgi:hypothetical protein